MCVSIPGTVQSVDGPVAMVELAGEVRPYNGLLFPELEGGERVLVHAGMVIQILTPEEAAEVDAAFEELARLDAGWVAQSEE